MVRPPSEAIWVAPGESRSLPWGPFTGYPTARPSITGIVSEAWRLLLLNQSHDPIYGCGVDEVYGDVANRFDACEQIGEDLVRRMLADIAAQVDTGGEPGVVVFNPVGGPRTDFVAFDWPLQDDGQAPLALVDAAGRRHACQVLSPVSKSPTLPFSRPSTVEIGFVARNVPGHGYKAFRAVCGPLVVGSGTTDAGRSIENEFFEVSADPGDGSISRARQEDRPRAEGAQPPCRRRRPRRRIQLRGAARRYDRRPAVGSAGNQRRRARAALGRRFRSR